MPDFGSPTSSTDSSEPATSSSSENEPNSDSLSIPRGSGSRKKGKSNVLKSASQQPAAQSNNLTDRIHAFKRNVAKLHKAHEKMLRRADELDQREQELLSREQSLNERESDFYDVPSNDNSDIEIERAELNLLAETLARRTIALDEREASLNAKEAEIEAARQDPPPTESEAINTGDSEREEFAQLREELAEQSKELARREKELEALQQSLQPQLDQLEADRKAFRQKQGHAKGVLTKRENKVEAEEQLLDLRETELREVRDELDRWQEEIDLQIASFDQRETSLAERSQTLEEQATHLDRRTADLLNLTTVLDQREHDLGVRESALNQVEEKLSLRSKNLDQAKALMELRRRRVKFVREQLGRVSRKIRKGRRRLFSRTRTSTVSIGPDDNELVAPTAESPSAPAPDAPQLTPAPAPSADQTEGKAVATKLASTRESKPASIADLDFDVDAEPLTATEKRVMTMVAIASAMIFVVGFASYMLAGVMTKPTWRATLVLKSDAITSPQSLTDGELAAALNYLNDRGLRPAEDVAAFRNLLAEKLTVTRSDSVVTLAYLDHQPELATFILKGIQRGIQLQRGDSVHFVSAAAIDPQPFDDPRWRITYVLMAIGLFVFLAGFGVVWRFTRRNRSE